MLYEKMSLLDLQKIANQIDSVIRRKILYQRRKYTLEHNHDYKYMFTGRHGSDKGIETYDCRDPECLASYEKGGYSKQYFLGFVKVDCEQPPYSQEIHDKLLKAKEVLK